MSICFYFNVFEAVTYDSEWTLDLINDHNMIRAYTRQCTFGLFHVQLTVVYWHPGDPQ